MKIKLTSGILIVLLISLLSCDTDEPDGKWDDNIKLSKKEVNIAAESTSVIVTTGGTSWWITGIGWNDNWSYDLSEIDTTQDNFLIEETGFIIERRNANEIHISLPENESGLEKTLTISLQAGNYFDGIKITQSAKQK